MGAADVFETAYKSSASGPLKANTDRMTYGRDTAHQEVDWVQDELSDTWRSFRDKTHLQNPLGSCSFLFRPLREVEVQRETEWGMALASEPNDAYNLLFPRCDANLGSLRDQDAPP